MRKNKLYEKFKFLSYLFIIFAFLFVIYSKSGDHHNWILQGNSKLGSSTGLKTPSNAWILLGKSTLGLSTGFPDPLQKKFFSNDEGNELPTAEAQRNSSQASDERLYQDVHHKNETPLSVLELEEIYSLNPGHDGNDIYLIWTTEANVTERSLCAAESWCLHHPRRKVWFTCKNKVVHDSDMLLQILLEHYNNLDFVYMDPNKVFNNTPFKSIVKSEKINKGFAVNNLSNFARQALIWHTGGLYADTDVIAIRNTNSMRNFVGLQSHSMLNNAVFHFDRETPFLKSLMYETAKNFEPSVWGWNGPAAMTRTINHLCGANSMMPMDNGSYRQCHGCNIVPTKSFYPIRWEDSKKYFEDGTGKNVMELLKDSYAIHLWNKLSSGKSSQFGSDSIYDAVTKSNCPVVYKAAQLRRGKMGRFR